jgi:3-oxoacyl-[acyl-carrier-protein] synthase-3
MRNSGSTPVLCAVGVWLPPQMVDNVKLAARLKVERDFLEDKLGFTRRVVKAPNETTSDMCVLAYRDLQRRTSIEPSSVELLCVVTQNPDSGIPHCAAIVHEKLELSAHCMTFDLSQGCAGYAHGLVVTTSLMEHLGFNDAIVFTCDPYSTIVDGDDRNTALIFSDAASATLIRRSSDFGYRIVDADFGTSPGTSACLRRDTVLRMDGRAILTNAAHTVPGSILRLLERNSLKTMDIDLFLLHPGSKYVVDLLRAELGVDSRVAPFMAGDYGNTVSSSIPLMLAELWSHQPARRILLSGFGVGFTWGTCLLESTEGKHDDYR